MNNRHGIFKKYFSVYALTMLTGTVMLGIVLIYVSSQYFGIDRRESLKIAADRALEATVDDLEKRNGMFVSRRDVEESYKLIYNATGITIFFSDSDGNVQMCSEGVECDHSVYMVPQRIRNSAVENGEVFDIGTLGGFYKNSRQYTYGVPLVSPYSDGAVLGFIFASDEITTLFAYLLQIIRIFAMSALIMLAISFVVMFFNTKKLVSPLREMSWAARSFGAGDFTPRVTVVGDDEIGQLSRIFNLMAESLDELESTRRNFVANVSHELRTPMTTIGGYIDGIRDGTIPYEEQGKYLDIVSDEVKRLSRLTTSMLDMSRIEAGEQVVKMVKHNLFTTISSVLIANEQRIEDKMITISEIDPEPIYAFCDPDMLHQVLFNLIDNAIKFTPYNGDIWISAADTGSHVEVLIRNSGEGIKKEDLGHIFDRFYKTDKSRSSDRIGAGLGLYIVKTLVQRMSGTITVNSEEGSYTEFCLQLSRCPSEEKKLTEHQRRSIFGKIKGFRKDERESDDRQQ